MKRSRGVTIYGTYALVVGSLNGAGNLALAVMVAKMGEASAISPLRPLLGALIGALMVAAGIGAFLLRPWGRTLAMAAAVAILAMTAINLGQIPAGEPARRIGFIAGYVVFPAALNGGILWFFTRPAVIAQFRRS